MTMTGLDWAILAICVAALSWFSLRTVKHMRSVADFLSANRTAGRYMLALDAWAAHDRGFTEVEWRASAARRFKWLEAILLALADAIQQLLAAGLFPWEAGPLRGACKARAERLPTTH